MAVYEGVLTYISGGSSVGGPTAVYDRDGYRADSGALSQVATRGANITMRQFIEIGGQRLNNVTLTNYHDELIQRYLGAHIAIAVTKGGSGWIVKSIGMPDGSVSKVSGSATAGSLLVVVLYSAVPLIFFAVLTIFGGFLTIIGLLGVGFFLFLIFRTARVTMGGNNELANWRPGGQGQAWGQQPQNQPMGQAMGQPAQFVAQTSQVAQAPQPPAPAPASADWQLTHTVPFGGMRAWANADPTASPSTMLQPGVELHLRETWGSWARVEGRNGWVGWVEGNLLQPAAVMAEAVPAPAPAS